MEQSTTEQPSRKPPRAWVNVALAAGALLVALLLAEVFLRLFNLGLPPFVATQESPGLFVASSVPGLYYELKPNFVGRAFACNVRVNSHGMRGPERSVEKPPGVKRVLVLGDSVAFGHGVEEPFVFPTVLEKLLNEHTTGGARVEVINAGVSGYNSEQERVFLREKGLAWKPDAVVVLAVVNDVEPPYDRYQPVGLWWSKPPAIYQEIIKGYFGGRGVRAYLERHVRLISLVDHAWLKPSFLTRRFLEYLDDNFKPDAPGWLGAQAALADMNALCRKNGIGLVLAHLPVAARPEPEVFRRIRGEFADFARRAGITYLDLFDAQNSKPVKQVTLSVLDRHPNALGHRLIAEALAPEVAAVIRR